MNEPRPSVVRFVRAVVRIEVERGGDGHVIQRVMMRLHDGLWKLIGPGGFDVLLARSVVLARKDHPVLAGVSAGPGGTLPGIDDAARDGAALQCGAVAIASGFIELLVRLVGEALAMRLVRGVWPGLEEEKE
jgi:hypothetical protein